MKERNRAKCSATNVFFGALIGISVAGFLAMAAEMQASARPAKAEQWKANGDELFARGRYREAAHAYERLWKAAGQNHELQAYARFRLGLCRFQDDRKSEAFLAWEQMRLFHPHSEYVSLSLLIEAENSPNPVRAEKLYDEILFRFPASMEAATILIKRGRAACDRKDYQTAARYWRQYLESFPQDPSVAEIQTQLETIELVLRGSAERAKGLEASSAVRTADALFDRAAFADAAKLYQKIAQAGGATEHFGHAVVRLSRCQLALGNQRAAFDTLQRAMDQLPGQAAPLLAELVSQSAARREGDELRLRATKLLLDRYPNTFEAQQALYIAGFVEMVRHNPPKAREWWEQLLSRFPQTGFREAIEQQLRFNAEAKKKQEQKKQAQEEAKRAKNRRSEERVRAEQRAKWQAEAREFAKIVADPTASSERRAEAAFQIAARSFYLQQYEVAAQQFQRVWTEFPASGRAEQAAFELAQMWFAAGHEKKGMEQLQFVANRFPSGRVRPLALYCLGNRYLLHDRNVKAAWTCYQSLMEEYPDHSLTEQTRRFWARLNQYPPENMKAPLANLKAKP